MATRSFTLTEPTAINTAVGSHTNVSCNGGSNGSATVSPTGGTPGYTYSWAPSGGTAATASGLAAGTYTVTVTDANGCIATRSFTITEPALLTTTGSQVDVTCFGGSDGSATVVASGGTTPYTYSWAPSGGTGATASGLTTNTYTVTVTDANGCIKTHSFIINQPPPVTADPVANQVVCNNSLTAAINFTGAQPGTIFNWTNTNTSIGLAASGTGNIPSFTAINAGNVPVTATITVTPSFPRGVTICTGTAVTFTITVNPTPNAVATPAAQTICSGAVISTIVLSGNVAGTVYNWARNNTGAVTGIAASGSGNISGSLTNTTNAPVTVTFTITPTFTNGGVTCTGAPITATVVVNPVPNVNTVLNQVLCKNAPTSAVVFIGSVPGTVFNWTNNNISIGLAASGTGNIPSFIAINNTGIAQVATIIVTPSFTNAGVTCTGTPKTFTIKVNPNLTGTIIGASNNQICSGQGASMNINLGGTPNFSGVVNIAVISGVGSPSTLLFNTNMVGASAVAIPAGNLVNNTGSIVTYQVSWLALADATGCPETTTGFVNISVLPTAITLNVSPGPGTLCPGTPISFDVTSPSGGTFSWEAHDGTSVIAGASNVPYGINAVSYAAAPCPYNKVLTFTFTPSNVVPACPGGGSVTRTVLVQDLTPPNFTVNAALQNTTIECNNTAAITAARNYTPTASDNCDSSPTVTETETVVTGCGGSRTYTTIFTATDDCGNISSTSTQVITVTDTAPPVIGNIAPQTLGCTGVIPNYITLLNLAAITTDCAPGVTFQQLPPYAPGTPVAGLSGTITIVIEATDACGNKSTKTFTVTLTPGAPTAVCKSSSPTIFVNLSANGTATITPALIDGGSFSNCSSITLSVSPSTFTCANIGVNAVTLTVTDGAGNTAQCTTNVTVRDITPPSMTACPSNITIAGGAGCNATATWTPPTATDNCGATVTGTHTPGQTFPAGTTTVVYIATDASGNSVTCSFTVTVTGSGGALAITCPGSINVNTNTTLCRASVATPNPMVTGNCGAAIQWTVSGATTGSGSGNLGTFIFNVGTSQVTYVATDGLGNSVTCSYLVIVTNAVAGSIGGTTTVQQSAVTTSPVTFTGSGGQSPYTFNYAINGVPQPPLTSVGNSIGVQQSNAVLGTFAYQLTGVTDANGCAGTLTPPTTATITVVVAGVPDLIVIPVQSSSQIGPGGTIQEVFAIRNIGSGPTTGPVTFTVNRFAPGSGLTATINTALSVNIGFDNFTLHNNTEAGWSVVTTASTFTFTYTGVIATGLTGAKNVGITVTRGTGANAGSNGTSNQTATIPGGTGGGESPTSNNSASVTIIKN